MKNNHNVAVVTSGLHHQHSFIPAKDGDFALDPDVGAMIENEPDERARQLLEDSVGMMYKTGETAEVEIQHMLKFLQSRQQQSLLCQRLPFTVLIFAVFTNMVMWHEDLSSASIMQRNLRGMIAGTTFEGVKYTSGHKEFYDIQTPQDIYTFLREALLPLLLHGDPEEVLRTQGEKELYRVLRYNRLIGGVQLLQQRWRTRSCSELYNGYDSTKAVVGGLTCFTTPGVDDCFGPMKFGVRAPGARTVLPGGFCGDGSVEGYGQLFYVPGSAGGAGSSAGSASNVSNSSTSASSNSSNSSSRRLGFPGDRLAAMEGASPSPSPPSRRPPAKRRRGRRGASDAAADDGAEARRLRMSAGRQSARAVTRSSPRVNPGIDIIESDTYSVLFTEEAGMPGALRKLKWLEDNNWMDLQTQRVGVNIFLLNPELSVYSHSTVNIYFGASGEVLPFLYIQTFGAEPYQNMAIVAIDVFFLLIILYAVVYSLARFFLAFYHLEMTSHLGNAWNWARMAMALGGVLVIVLWSVGYERLFAIKDLAMQADDWMSKAIAKQQAQRKAGQPMPQAPLPNASFANSSLAVGMQLKGIGDDPDYVRLLLAMHKQTADFSEYVTFYRRVLAAYGVLLLAGFMRLFQMQPRLAMLTNTLALSWKDVVHHMIVFIMLWLAFAAAGMLIFSRTVFAFGGFFTAMTKTFTIMLGDIDWEELAEENPTLAAVWLWVFLSLMMLLMLNMLMAIIMDVYMEVKKQALEGDPIWVTVYATIVEWLEDRDVIGPRALERILLRLQKGELQKVSAKLLEHLIPGISREQAVETVAGSLYLKAVTDGTSMTLSQMQRLIGRIHLHTDALALKSETMVEDMKAEREMNREMAERRRAVREQRASEMVRLQADERWEHSRRFQRRTRAIESKLQRGEQLMQDYIAWLSFRGRQVDEQVAKIERLIRNRARPPGEEVSPRQMPATFAAADGRSVSSSSGGIGGMLSRAGFFGNPRALQELQGAPPQRQGGLMEWFGWNSGQAAATPADMRNADSSPQGSRVVPFAQARRPSPGASKVAEVLRPAEGDPSAQPRTPSRTLPFEAMAPSVAQPPFEATPPPQHDRLSPAVPRTRAQQEAASGGSARPVPPPQIVRGSDSPPSRPAAPSREAEPEPAVPRGLGGINLEDDDMPLPRLGRLGGGPERPRAERGWLALELEEAEEELSRSRPRSRSSDGSGRQESKDLVFI